MLLIGCPPKQTLPARRTDPARVRVALACGADPTLARAAPAPAVRSRHTRRPACPRSDSCLPLWSYSIRLATDGLHTGDLRATP